MCVICKGKYYNPTGNDFVCDYHENWIVTVCSQCHKSCYSDVVHICPRCLKLSEKIIVGGFSKDHRARLRKYGQE